MVVALFTSERCSVALPDLPIVYVLGWNPNDFSIPLGCGVEMRVTQQFGNMGLQAFLWVTRPSLIRCKD